VIRLSVAESSSLSWDGTIQFNHGPAQGEGQTMPGILLASVLDFSNSVSVWSLAFGIYFEL